MLMVMTEAVTHDSGGGDRDDRGCSSGTGGDHGHVVGNDGGEGDDIMI